MQQEPVRQHSNEAKTSVVAGILGVFLGGFGAHDWYLGKTKEAITHVCLFVGGVVMLMIGLILTNLFKDIPVLFALFVCILIAASVIIVGDFIWGFIEGVIIIAQGDAGLAAKGYKIAQPATETMKIGTQANVGANAAPASNAGAISQNSVESAQNGGNTVSGNTTSQSDGNTSSDNAVSSQNDGNANEVQGDAGVSGGAGANMATAQVTEAPAAQGAPATDAETKKAEQDEAEAMAIINQAASDKNNGTGAASAEATKDASTGTVSGSTQSAAADNTVQAGEDAQPASNTTITNETWDSVPTSEAQSVASTGEVQDTAVNEVVANGTGQASGASVDSNVTEANTAGTNASNVNTAPADAASTNVAPVNTASVNVAQADASAAPMNEAPTNTPAVDTPVDGATPSGN